MSEWDLVWRLCFRLIPSALFMLCYAIGGRTSKWVRRYIGPVVFTLSCAILAFVFGTFSWKILIFMIYAPILTLPYHSTRERTFYVVAMTVSALICGIVLGSSLGILQAAIAFCVGTFFTESHPVPAVNEEGLIALLSIVVLPFIF